MTNITTECPTTPLSEALTDLNAAIKELLQMGYSVSLEGKDSAMAYMHVRTEVFARVTPPSIIVEKEPVSTSANVL